MARFPKLDHPKIDKNPSSQLSVDAQPGTSTLIMLNTLGFRQGDFVLLGKYSEEQAEIVPIISSVVSPTQINIGAPRFGHPADSTITRMDFDLYRVYRSITGLGGYYSLLDTQAIQVSNSCNVYADTYSQSPFSYRFTYFNSASNTETDLSDEIPYSGFPFYSMGKIASRAMDIYGDPVNEYVTKDMLQDWTNEFLERMMFEVTGGDSPYFVNSYTFPVNALNGSIDISNYNLLSIFLIEYSLDNLKFTQEIVASDFRNYGSSASSATTYDIVGNILQLNNLPKSGWIRVWGATDPILIGKDSDVLPEPFRGVSHICINWILRRCNEKDRKVQELGAYYDKQIENDTLTVIRYLQSRLRGRLAEGTNWADYFTAWTRNAKTGTPFQVSMLM